MKNYGEIIRIARKHAGLTQKELAEKAGVAKITIQQYEAGKRQPRLEQLEMLADAMKMDIGELLSTQSKQ